MDPSSYLGAFAPEVAYFDPTTDAGVNGIEAIQMRPAPIKNLKPPFTDEMIGPKVLRYGDVAVLTFKLVDYRKLGTGENVVARWNSTEVDSRIDGKRMSSELMALHFKTREEWRAWLARHHSSSLEIWFVFYKSHTG